MSDVRDFLFWFGSILATTFWVGGFVNGHTQYAGTLIGLLLSLWLSVAVGSIVFLVIGKVLFLFARYFSGSMRTVITVRIRVLSRKWTLRPIPVDLPLK